MIERSVEKRRAKAHHLQDARARTLPPRRVGGAVGRAGEECPLPSAHLTHPSPLRRTGCAERRVHTTAADKIMLNWGKKGKGTLSLHHSPTHPLSWIQAAGAAPRTPRSTHKTGTSGLACARRCRSACAGSAPWRGRGAAPHSCPHCLRMHPHTHPLSSLSSPKAVTHAPGTHTTTTTTTQTPPPPPPPAPFLLRQRDPPGPRPRPRPQVPQSPGSGWAGALHHKRVSGWPASGNRPCPASA